MIGDDSYTPDDIKHLMLRGNKAKPGNMFKPSFSDSPKRHLLCTGNKCQIKGRCHAISTQRVRFCPKWHTRHQKSPQNAQNTNKLGPQNTEGTPQHECYWVNVHNDAKRHLCTAQTRGNKERTFLVTAPSDCRPTHQICLYPSRHPLLCGTTFC